MLNENATPILGKIGSWLMRLMNTAQIKNIIAVISIGNAGGSLEASVGAEAHSFLIDKLNDDTRAGARR